MAKNGTSELPVKRAPWGELPDLRESMRSLFDWTPFRSPFWEVREPAVDMFERDGKIVVKAEMPGIAPDKIDVTVSDGELRISGERREEKEVKEEHYYRSERSFGRIFRSLPLPEGCDRENVTATAKDGVVEVVIPRKPAAVGKKVEVKAG